VKQYIAIAAILALIGAFAGGEWHGRQSERAKWEARINKERAEASESARKQERAQQEQVNESLRKENERMASINAGLAADLDELRNRPPRRVPETPGTSCEGATGAELSGPDAGFLAGLAARADRHRAALATCYEYADTVTAR
jgi:hypothetical protein